MRKTHSQKQSRKAVPSYVKKFAWELADGRCWYCGVELNPFGETDWDHVTPLVQGGGENYWNIVPSCRSCNRSKSHHTIDQWRHRMGRDHLFWFETDEGRAQKRIDALTMFSLDDYEPYEEVPDIILSEMKHPKSMMRKGIAAIVQDMVERTERAHEMAKKWDSIFQVGSIEHDCFTCGNRTHYVTICRECIDRRIVLGKITPVDFSDLALDRDLWIDAHRGLPTEFARHIAQDEEDVIADRMYQQACQGRHRQEV